MEPHGGCECNGCREPVYQNGLCREHYADHRITTMVKQRKKEAEARRQRRFWSQDTVPKGA